MSTSSTEGPTADVSVRMGHVGVRVRTGRRTRVQLSDEPWGELHIYAPGVSDLPDTFVLCNATAQNQEDAFYWCEKSASAARKQKDGLWVLDFDEAENEGGRRPDDLMSRQLTYTLVHRPAGDARGQRTVFDGRAQGRVFHAGGFAGSSSADAFMWDFVALQCYLSDAVRMPEGSVERSKVELRPPDALKDAADPLSVAATTSSAWEPVADRGRAWRAGTRPPDDAEDDASANRTPGEDGAYAELDQPLPDLETWISFMALKAQEDVFLLGGDGASGNGASAGAPFEFGTAFPAPFGPRRAPVDGQLRPESVSVWKVDAEGLYHFAAYPGGGGASAFDPEAMPEVMGPSTPFVLMDAGLIEHRTETVYAHVSYAPLPLGRYADLARRQAEGRFPPLVPFDFRRQALAGGPDVFAELDGHARWDGDAKVWAWYLPDPLRVTRRLARQAAREARRFGAWNAAAGSAQLGSGLVAATCYRPEHRRAYLAERLSERLSERTKMDVVRHGHRHQIGDPVFEPDPDPAHNMEKAWKGFDPDAVEDARVTNRLPGSEAWSSPTIAPQLRHFQYGVRCQRAYLRHRMQVAGYRLEAWMGGAAYAELELDLAIARKQGALAGDTLERACEVLFASQAAMCDTGAGGAVLGRRFARSGLLEKIKALVIEDYGQLLEPLRDAEEASWQDLLDAPAFTISWTLVEKGGKSAATFMQAAAPMLVATRKVVREPAPQSLVALFAWELMKEHDSGAVRVHKASGDLYEIGDVAVKRTRVRGVRTQRRFGAGRSARWRVSYTEERATPNPTVAQGLAIRRTIGAANLAITGITLFAHARDGELSAGDAVALGKGVIEGAGFFDLAASTGRALSRASLVLEVAGAAVSMYEAHHAEIMLGAQDVPDVDEWGVAGAIISGAGGMLLGLAGSAAGSTGAVVLGLVSAPVAAVIGLAMIAGGIAAPWIGDELREAERRRRDPLWQWLPDGSVWGQAYAAAGQRKALFQLVRPGADEGAVQHRGGEVKPVLGTEMNAQTEAFLKEAYVFPTSVAVKPAQAGDGVEGLTLQVVPAYLPLYGTLMVDANVQALNDRGAEVGRPAGVRCAVHYVKAKSGYRYCLKSEGAALDLSEAETLAEQAERERWARAETVEVWAEWTEEGQRRRRREERKALLIRVGAGWSMRRATELEQLTAPAAEQELERRLKQMETWPERYREQYAGEVERLREIEKQKERVRKATEAGVDAGSVLPPEAAPGLSGVLEGGYFRVTGSVYFAPLAPFDPSTQMPADDALLSEELIEFEYPDDAR